MGQKFDVTVSVWNKFHSFPLIDGLTRNGYQVLSLGTTKQRPNASAHRLALLSKLMHLYHLKGGGGSCAVEYSLKLYENFASKQVADSDVYWAWSSHHLKAFRKAKQLGKTVILERGSTHPRWRLDRMNQEKKRAGHRLIGLHDAILEKELEEIEVADAICIPSRFVADTFLEYGVAESKLRINPYGADVNFWSQAYHEREGRETRPLTFVWAGGVMLRKGIYYLLEAWKKAQLSNARLMIAGGISPDAEDVVKYLPSGVELLGDVSHTKLRELYKRADIGILPSLEEGMARSLLEALSAGMPLIITQESGVGELMDDGKNGWIVEAMSVDSLVDALEKADAARPSMDEMAASAYAAVKDYTWQAYGDRAAKILAEMIANSGGSK